MLRFLHHVILLHNMSQHHPSAIVIVLAASLSVIQRIILCLLDWTIRKSDRVRHSDYSFHIHGYFETLATFACRPWTREWHVPLSSFFCVVRYNAGRNNHNHNHNHNQTKSQRHEQPWQSKSWHHSPDQTSRKLGSLSFRLEWRFCPDSFVGGQNQDRDQDWDGTSPTLLTPHPPADLPLPSGTGTGRTLRRRNTFTNTKSNGEGGGGTSSTDDGDGDDGAIDSLAMNFLRSSSLTLHEHEHEQQPTHHYQNGPSHQSQMTTDRNGITNAKEVAIMYTCSVARGNLS